MFRLPYQSCEIVPVLWIEKEAFTFQSLSKRRGLFCWSRKDIFLPLLPLANSIRGNYFELLFFKNALEEKDFPADNLLSLPDGMLIFEVCVKDRNSEKISTQEGDVISETAPWTITRRLILDFRVHKRLLFFHPLLSGRKRTKTANKPEHV